MDVFSSISEASKNHPDLFVHSKVKCQTLTYPFQCTPIAAARQRMMLLLIFVISICLIFNEIFMLKARFVQRRILDSVQVIPELEVSARRKFCGCKAYVSIIWYISNS